MPDYRKMYFSLFNEITDVIVQLQAIQVKMEELYIGSTDTALCLEQEAINTDNDLPSALKLKQNS